MQLRSLVRPLALTALWLGPGLPWARAQCGAWSGGHGGPGMDDAVHVLATWDDGSGPVTVAGGAFHSAVDVAARHVARWDGTRWGALGGGVEFEVDALTGFHEHGQQVLVAGGHHPGQVAVGEAAIARWDGDAWSPLAGSIQGSTGASVRALAVYDDGGGPALFAAGTFTSIDGKPVSRVARWEGSGWSEVGGGVDGPVNALAVYDDGAGPQLVAAGSFDHAGGVTVLDVARWNGRTWSSVGFALLGEVHDLVVHDDGAGPKLYAATASSVRCFDGTTWTTPGGGLGQAVHALGVHDAGQGPALFAGTRDGVLRLASGGWEELGPRTWTTWSSGVLALEPVARGPQGRPALLVGGRLSVWEPVIAFHCLALEGGTWRPFGAGPAGRHAVTAGDLALFDDGSGPGLYVGGQLWEAGRRPAHALLKRVGAGWEAVDGLRLPLGSGGLGELCAHPGSATVAGGLYAICDRHGLVRFDGQGWSRVAVVPGVGIEGYVNAMEVYGDGSGSGPRLYVAGYLGSPFGTWNIVAWDGAGWSYPGQGAVGIVYALQVHDDGSGSALYAGGLHSQGVRRWDGNAWSVPGSGVDGTVTALAVFDDGSGPSLYAGGEFRTAGGRPARHLARWDGSRWEEVGGGLTSDADEWTVGALACFDDGSGPRLVVTGCFSAAGGLPLSHAAAWDGTRWSELGAGLGEPGWKQALLQHDEGGVRTLWASGGFTWSGDRAAWHLARWRDACTSEPVAYCAPTTSSLGCAPRMRWDGTPSASDPAPFWIAARGVDRHRSGLLLYGLAGQASVPFQGGTLCVASPLRRTPLQASGGDTTSGDCSGAFQLDFNAWIQGGADPGLIAGAQVRAQHWYRDPGSPLGGGLSDAIAFGVGP